MEFDRLKNALSRPASAIEEMKRHLEPLSIAEQMKRNPGLLSAEERLNQIREQAVGLALDRPFDQLTRMATEMKDRLEGGLSRDLGAIAARREEMMRGLHDQFGRQSEMAMRADAMLGREKAIESFSRMHSESLGRATDQIKEMADHLSLRRSADELSFRRSVDELSLRPTAADFASRASAFGHRDEYYSPGPVPYVPKIETPNFAKQKIAAIQNDEQEKQDQLEYGKVLKMYVAVGGIQFFVSGADAFTARDKTTIDIAAFNGDNVVTLNVPYNQIVIIYEVADLDVPDHPTIH